MPAVAPTRTWAVHESGRHAASRTEPVVDAARRADERE
jgi:hypothetical protein